ncbi:hypothetical protein SAMN05444369_11016 [Capnocytophaga haemolytica]|jgi:hypothetical protein|uniref:Uncharacterized protein n=1 Tax=Capnocytophaga haemolytica TaxID=45243 RepID=A0AAX2GU42_9FLAO|nr:hypothetical protein [Capnocytophaga haemolytica]AMD85442.1 hypothetical protein AXF12_07900 [Capnocytophaga haemolytica]SFO12196.1 hypothetical protein SAMN05444369_11016 [Capnocytophaga haemolytica]SNV01557.1 Uncharacterised protein [Capnocytophaga haemolytica]
MDKNVRKQVFTNIFNEKRSLDGKIQKLENFIESNGFKLIDRTQQSLLIAQYEAMLNYSSILEKRLDTLR